MKRSLLLFFAILSLSVASSARSNTVPLDLKLLPAPRLISVRPGEFLLSPETSVVLDSRYREEDQTAANMLIEEIAQQSGLKLSLRVEPQTSSGFNSIRLAHLDDTVVRTLLKSHGLDAGQNFDPQGYLLFADTSSIVVAAETSQGLFYGVQTLRQLLRPSVHGYSCPLVSITDWPAMQWRGIQDDVSRGPIPTLDYMKKQVRLIASFKMNLFALYMEHVFEYRSQPLLAPRDYAITAAELTDLTQYAKRYFVTVLPEQQTFGHFHHILEKEIYSDVAERPHGQTLSPVCDETYTLIASMYSELAPLTPGPFLHIGTDEAFELGTGRSKSRTQQLGVGAVYGQHLLRVAQILEPYHKRVIFWGDIAGDYPEQLNILPKSMIGMPWSYDAEESFDKMIEPFHRAGLDVMVAPGANNWEDIWPNLDVAYVNIRNFVRDGQKYGALGVLNTTWNDDGESFLDMAWPAFVFGGAAGWQAGETSIEVFKNSYDWAFYRNPGFAFRDVIENLDKAHRLLNTVGLSQARDDLIWANPFSASGAETLQKALPVAHELRISAESAAALLSRNRYLARSNGDTLNSLAFAAERLDYLGMQIQFTSEMNAAYWDSFKNQTDTERVLNNFDEITGTNARLEDLRDTITYLRDKEEQQWSSHYTPYWHANVLLRYNRLAMVFESQISSVRDAAVAYRARKSLPSPEQIGFYLKP